MSTVTPMSAEQQREHARQISAVNTCLGAVESRMSRLSIALRLIDTPDARAMHADIAVMRKALHTMEPLDWD